MVETIHALGFLFVAPIPMTPFATFNALVVVAFAPTAPMRFVE